MGNQKKKNLQLLLFTQLQLIDLGKTLAQTLLVLIQRDEIAGRLIVDGEHVHKNTVRKVGGVAEAIVDSKILKAQSGPLAGGQHTTNDPFELIFEFASQPLVQLTEHGQVVSGQNDRLKVVR